MCFATFASSGDSNEVNGTNENKGAPTSSINIRDHQRRLLDDITASLTKERYRNIVVVNGAGVSTSCGIPDFRTPGTGLYSKLEEYDLPYPEAIFDLDFFRSNPAPFYRLCQELWPGRYAPTPTHRFIKLLDQKELLVRCYTQNIDSLESLAGTPKELVVAAHGNFDSATCVGTGASVPVEELKEAIGNGGSPEVVEAGWKALAEKHGGLVKPDASVSVITKPL